MRAIVGERFQAGEQPLAVTPGGLGLGGRPACGCPLDPGGGRCQAEREQGRDVSLQPGRGQRRQPISGRLDSLLVVAFPQRQLRPGDGERDGELGVEVHLAELHGQPTRLQEQATRGGEVAAGDVEPGPPQPRVHPLGAGEPVPLQGGVEVPVGLVPTAKQEL